MRPNACLATLLALILTAAASGVSHADERDDRRKGRGGSDD